jgi:elongation of very long chain fatty acids protein 6
MAALSTVLALVVAAAARPTHASLLDWMPDRATLYKDLTFKPTPALDAELAAMTEFKGMKFSWKPENWEEHWASFVVSLPTWTASNWWIPLMSVATYFMLIPTLRWLVATRGKWNVRTFAFYWNAGLSIFSWCGVFACVPVLVGSFFTHGLYFTTCAPATWYGGGLSGFFVALFIYSKVAELVDTYLLLLAKKPVIALQWWHHSTVLLYCWHSYSARIATGLWFAAMNYSVHSVMYGYFATVSTKYRKFVAPYAIFITLAQLAQMLVGMFVTIKAVMYQNAGLECHVNKTNSVLGLAMYASYFVLFFKLFIENYVTQTRKRPDGPAVVALAKKQSISEVTRKLTRKMTQQIVPQMDDEDAKGDEEGEDEKKQN